MFLDRFDTLGHLFSEARGKYSLTQCFATFGRSKVGIELSTSPGSPFS
jgi:hypothetical protein